MMTEGISQEEDLESAEEISDADEITEKEVQQLNQVLEDFEDRAAEQHAHADEAGEHEPHGRLVGSCEHRRATA